MSFVQGLILKWRGQHCHFDTKAYTNDIYTQFRRQNNAILDNVMSVVTCDLRKFAFTVDFNLK